VDNKFESRRGPPSVRASSRQTQEPGPRHRSACVTPLRRPFAVRISLQRRRRLMSPSSSGNGSSKEHRYRRSEPLDRRCASLTPRSSVVPVSSPSTRTRGVSKRPKTSGRPFRMEPFARPTSQSSARFSWADGATARIQRRSRFTSPSVWPRWMPSPPALAVRIAREAGVGTGVELHHAERASPGRRDRRWR
jgi:hypothetical protein